MLQPITVALSCFTIVLQARRFPWCHNNQ